jgi:hypothetical protein
MGRYLREISREEDAFMVSRVRGVALLGMVLVLGVIQVGNADGQSRQKAVEAAKKWLALVDRGEYGKSWETAAGYFKAAAGKKHWEQTGAAVRSPLGKVIIRKLKSRQYVTSLPGAPDGEYVVIQFETSFEKKKSSVETVTPMKEEDGTWRVSGYYIK